MSEFQKDKITAQADELTRESMAAFERWLERHPEVIPCDANIRMFTAYADFSEGLTEVEFDFCFSNIKDRLALQTLKRAKERATDAEAETKAGLINEIIELLRTGGARSTPHDLRTERAKLGFQSVPQLQARRDSIVEKQRLSKMPVAQIRQEIAASRPRQETKVLPAEITTKVIRSMQSWEIRKLIRDWGASVVNDRLFGR